MTREIYDPMRFYSPDEYEMAIFGSVEKLAQWRHRGMGPAFTKIGRQVRYLGSDLNDYLNRNRVTTADQPV